jgi:hypothetical protein
MTQSNLTCTNKVRCVLFIKSYITVQFFRTTVYEREGEKVKDHTIAIDESRPHGYGVRADKKKGKPVKSKPMPPQERGKAPPAQYDDGIPRPKPM